MCAASRRTEGSCTKVPRLRSNDEDTPLFQIHSHSMASVLPSRHSSCLQFSAPSRAECRQVTPCRVSSASGTKVGTTFFKLRALSFFVFVPKRAADRLWKLDSAENARFETQPSRILQAASCNRKRISTGGLHAIRKTPGRGSAPSAGKVSSLRWLAYELADGL